MGNEMFQARLDDEFASEVHEYREERHMSKSEVVRHGLRELVQQESDEAEADDEGASITPEERDKQERIKNLAHVGEKAAWVGIVCGFVALLIPTLTVTTVNTFGLTIGEFGLYLTISLVLLASTLTLASIGIAAGFIAEAFVRYGIQVGLFGQILGRYTTPNQEVGA